MLFGLVASLRSQTFFAEQIYQSTFHYSIGPLGDILCTLRHFPLASAASAELKAQTDDFVPCEENGVGTPCVDVVFVWAPKFVDQLKCTQRAIDLIQPQVVLVSVGGHERKSAMDSLWEKMWDNLFSNIQLDSW
eukprot:CAMPEP_0196574786 /NCGR_PEP_ID=MMETSP1081-20130531/4422_1 /TAXON_ID=36882 /ORGANISM="Pyramimonas amylifera, Strain CCMP720" /LENGTH=133 /DNA_ID=CAMNT_0041892901 /DNA_START=42 /DNA_END=440 /DNA_ORIENTATION=-